MKWITVIIISISLLLSCSKKPSPPTTPTEAPVPENNSLESMNVSSVDLYHHDPRPTFGETRKPTLWLHAEKFAVIDENTWKVEDVHAVIYDAQSDTENIKLSAKEGIFEKMSKASLSGNVEAQMSNMTFKTESIEWNNRTETEPAKIWSHGQIELQGTDVQLHSSSLLIYPETKEFELEEVSGQLPLVIRSAT